MEPLCDKVAIVAGASSGIGEAIARALVILGVHVIGVARRTQRLENIAESLQGAKGSFDKLFCDLREEEDILNVFQFANEKFGGIDILVNDAGLGFAEAILNGSTAHFRNILEVNTLAPAITMREGVRSILKRGNNGHIVNIISDAALEPLAVTIPLSLYEGSKSGLMTITEKVRQEIQQLNYPIKIIGIYPGEVNTEFFEKAGIDPELALQSPHLEPEDIADVVVFALQAPRNVEIQRLLPAALHDPSAL